jgi:hypothetical protein
MLRRFIFALALFFPLAAHAQALPCPAYPNTLTNGTLADANQVMANFNTIRNCVNALAPLAVPVVGSSSNIRAQLASAGTTVTVTADTVTLGTALNGTPYTLTSYSQSFNGSTVGAGGMDVGSIPTSGYLALYAIYNPTAPAVSILGTTCASSCPTVYAGGSLPAGYTASALLTVVPTNATPAMKPFAVRGKTVVFGAINGPTTTVNVSNGTSASIATAVPPNAISVGGSLFASCGTAPGANVTSVAVGSDTNLSGLQQLQGNCNSLTLTIESPFSALPLTTAQTIYWGVTVQGTGPSALVQLSQYTIP